MKRRNVKYAESDAIDGIKYDKHGRMLFHPDFHFNHSKPFTQEELEYLCMFYEIDETRTVAFALGKTEHTLRVRYNRLKKDGLVDKYRASYMRRLEEECNAAK